MLDGPATEGSPYGARRFAISKFRPTALPAHLVPRPRLHDRLTDGSGARLTVVVGSAGAGKSVLLSSWAASKRPPGSTCWLSCDEADAEPVRFWTAFIEAGRQLAPEFGTDALDLLAIEGGMSPDVIAAIANDAAALPPGSVMIVDDFHDVGPAVATDMTQLVECWPADSVQLVLAGRSDPPLRLHRLRMADELCELRDRDLHLSLPESRDLLAGFGVELGADDLAQVHERTEGWAAAVQMVALSLRGATDPTQAAHARTIRSHEIAAYFVSEVLDRQPHEISRFMLDTSVLDELTVGACTALTQGQDAARLLPDVAAANLFLVPLDDDRSSFRYHHLVHQVLRAELRARDHAHEQQLQARAGEWFERNGDARRAARHFLAAGDPDRALSLIQDRVVPEFLRHPVLPPALDLDTIAPSMLVVAPDRALAVAADLLQGGDVTRGGEILDLLENARPAIAPDSRLAARLAAMRSFQYGMAGLLEAAVESAGTAREVQRRTQLVDDWNVAVPLVLLRIHNCWHDPVAIEREAATVLAMPGVPEVARLVLVPGARALARFDSGQLSAAADSARIAAENARRLGFDQHFFAVDHLRALAGLALERRDLDTAERLTEQALSISERRRPLFEFLTLLDRAAIWAARGESRDALTSIDAARETLSEASPALLAGAAELEALLRLSLGDARSAAELAAGLPEVRRTLLLARIELAAADHLAAEQHLQSLAARELTTREALVRALLTGAAAIGRCGTDGDAGLGEALLVARKEGFVNTVVTVAPSVTRYLIEHSDQARHDPYLERLVAAALEVRAVAPQAARSGRVLPEALTEAEMRIIKLLPTNTYLQMAATLYVSRNTVKTHLRSIYQKLGVSSRADAIQRAVDLRLL